jgi:hypothetical protein
MTDADPARKWSPLDEATWLARADAIRKEGKPNDWWLRGPCPGCGHTISRNITPLIGVAFIDGTPPPKIVLKCNCSQPHDGRPQDASPPGCGAAGGVIVKL